MGVKRNNKLYLKMMADMRCEPNFFADLNLHPCDPHKGWMKDQIIEMLGGKEDKRAPEGKKYVMPRGQEYNSDFSIGDYLVPEPEPFVDFLLMIIRKLTEGKRVNIFCTAGEGRSGM